MINTASTKSKALLKLTIFISIIITVILAFQAGAYAISLTATPDAPDTDTRIRLSWTSVPGAVAYAVYRDGDFGNPVGTTDINQQNYLSIVDDNGGAGLTPASQYSYVVEAYSDPGMTALLQQSSAISCKTTPMIRPTITYHEYNIETKVISLFWTNTSLAARGSIIKRVDNGRILATLNGPDSQAVFTDPDLRTGSVQYVVISTDLNAGDEHLSDPSAPVTVVPFSPTSLTATMTNGTATISWGSSFSQISRFQLERSSYNGPTWSGWDVVNRNLSGSSATNTPASAGMYRYRLNARASSNYSGSFLSNSVVKPAILKNLAAVLINNNQIKLTWDTEGMNYANLQVERRAGSQAYSVIEVLGSSANAYMDYLDLASNTTYSYRVTAYVSNDNKASSNEISISTSVPAAPTNLSVIVNNDVSSHVLTWKDNSNSETSFNIERSENGGAFGILDTVGANIVSYTVDSGVIQTGTSYVYRVAACNPFGVSKYSNEVAVGTSITTNVPTSLTVKAISSSRIDLVWAYAGNGSYSSVVERRTGWDGSWLAVATLPAGTYKYSDSALSSNTQYFYRVRCRLGSGLLSDSFPSGNNGKDATTMLGGLRLTGRGDSGNRIYLSWSGNSADGDVTIERKMANGSFAVLATVGPSSSGWHDETGLVPGAVYTYRIKTKTAINESVYSNEVTVSNYYLEAPSDLTASANATAGIDLKWKDNSSDETGFEIWRQVEDADDFTLYATVDRNITTFTDKSTRIGVEYYYMVRAYTSNPEMYSDYTDIAGRGTGIITAPSDLKFIYESNTEGVLTWKDNSSNEYGFEVEWKIGEDGEWSELAWLSANKTSYEVDSLNQYNVYYFRVRAYSRSGNFDAVSGELVVSTAIPATPTDVTAVAVSANQINIQWTDNANNENGYRIMRKTSTQSYYSVTDEVGAGVTSYTDRGLYSNVTYTYKVAAFNGSGSAESDEVSATTGKRVTFSDVGTAYNWARDAIENLAGRGVLNGKDTGKYAPGDTLTKAEFVAMMLRAFKLQTTPVGSFADVKPGKWYYNDIMAASYFGIISADSSNRFYPEQAITREEIALIITKTLEAAGRSLDGYANSVLEKFYDKDQISPYAVASVASLVGEGVLTGVTDSSIAPRNSATRAQAAVFIYRVIDR